MGRCGVWSEFADGELVVAALLGNLQAFDELVRRFRPAVRLTARRYVEHEEVIEDLCQEAFLRAFKALPHLEELERFGAWLLAITRNLALRQRQNEARHRERCSALDQLLLEQCVSLEPSPPEIVERDEEEDTLRKAVAELPEVHRVIVDLHYWGEMPLPRIADTLSLPLSTVKWRLRRAQALLRQQLQPPLAAACGGQL